MMEFVNSRVIHSIVFLLALGSSVGAPPKICKVPNGNAGVCTLLTSCDPLLEIAKNANRTKLEEIYVRQSVGECGSAGVKLKICCPHAHSWKELKINPVIYPDPPVNLDSYFRIGTDDSTTNAHIAPVTLFATGASADVNTDDVSGVNTNNSFIAHLQIATSNVSTNENVNQDPGNPPITGPQAIPPTHASSSSSPTDEHPEENTRKPFINTPRRNRTSASPYESPKREPRIANVPDEEGKYTCGFSGWNTNRIVGGNPTNIDDYPWLALLEYRPEVLACGGSLISNRFVLTAAHCLYGGNGAPNNVRLSEYDTSSYPTDVVEVSGGGQETITVEIISIEWSLKHPEHEEHSTINDIGLIKLSRNVEMTDFIQTICMPHKNYLRTFTEDVTLVAAGWGIDDTGAASHVKRDLVMPYVPREKCRKSYRTVHERELCAGGQRGNDTCSGDSGGPLMYERNGVYTVVGVVARGAPKCGTEGKPGIYTYVYDYMHWIKKIITDTTV